MRIQSTATAEQIRHVKLLVSGAPGSGKTRFASTAPNPLVLSAEGGLMTLQDKDVPFISTEDLVEDYGGLLEGLKELVNQLQMAPDDRTEMQGLTVDSFVIDTIDELGRLLMKEHLIKEKTPTARIQDFGFLKDTLTNFTRAIRNLDMHVILTSHLKTVGGDDTIQRMMPAIDGSFSEAIPGYVDVATVLHADLDTIVEDNQTKKVVNRWLQLYPDNLRDWIKDRSSRLPQRFELNGEDDFSRMSAIMFPDKKDNE